MDWMLLSKLAFMVFALFCGFGFLFLWEMLARHSEYQTKTEQLEERHNNISVAENLERQRILEQAGYYSFGSREYNFLMEQYEQLAQLHRVRWNERVREIVDREVRISEAEQEELDRGADWREAVRK